MGEHMGQWGRAAGAGQRILIVDDHEANLFALESALAPLGHPIERATGGDEALKAALRGGVAVIVLDLLMPGVGGLDVVRYLKALEATADIPVVLVSAAEPTTAVAEQAMELGVADLLVKPIDPWALRIKVEYLYRSAAGPVDQGLYLTTRVTSPS
ncbi:response regulator [Streptomyces sp. NPDC001941]|uniref:response regulator n=1 Tax=Streptomyces sp. NPDC001941 TaxID=3154659 RepID=UPI00332EB872